MLPSLVSLFFPVVLVILSSLFRLVGLVSLIILVSLVFLVILRGQFELVFLEFYSSYPALSVSEALVILAIQVSLPSLVMLAIPARRPKLVTLGIIVGIDILPILVRLVNLVSPSLHVVIGKRTSAIGLICQALRLAVA